MISVRRLLLREFLIVGSLAVILLLGARGTAELLVLREQSTSQAEAGGKLLVDGISHQTRDAEELGGALALMWRRGELAPDHPGTELALEGLLRQSHAQNLILVDTQGRIASAHAFDGSYRTRSVVLAGGTPRIIEKVWDEDGRVAGSAPLDLVVPDYTQRPWYRLAMESPSPAWTGVYLFISPETAGVTYCRKVVDGGGRTLGVVGVDLRLDKLEQLTRKYKPTPQALVCLTAKDGRLLASPDTEDGGALDGTGTNPLTQAASSSGEADHGWPLVRAGGRFWLVHRDEIRGPGWKLLIAIPVEDLISRPRKITLVALFVGFLTILGIAFRLAVVSRRITQPLIELARSSEGLLAGHLTPLPPTDIHELAQARAALEAASAGMKERHQLELELQRVQRLELVGTMAAGLAHDMNNHLAAIQGQIQVAALKAPEGPQAPHIAQAGEACGRMARLLQDLVSFGKPREHSVDKVDLNALVAQAGKLLEHSRGKRMQVELDLDQTNPAVVGDRIQIEQVILNLGFNAKDASREGGRLSLMTGHKDGEAFFEVSDTGTGMTADVKDKLFTPFFSTKRDQGTGLGLAMVASIVKAHEGRITVESEPGHGSIFTVWLPLAKDR
ncbi:MAG TPA: ATP-binding protein [Holophagaceae bacterium]|nr:ATP-binding protein [Holophagaceae bacterium]